MKKIPVVATLGVSCLAVGTVFAVVTMVHEAANSHPSSVEQPSSPVQAQPSPKPTDNWDVDRHTSELDGVTRVTLTRGTRYTGAVIVRCDHGKIDGYVTPILTNLGGMLDTSDYSSPVRFRLDDGPVQKGTWSVSTDFESLFFPGAVLRRLPKANKLVIEYRPEYTTSQTETFDLTGLADAENAADCFAKVEATQQAARAAQAAAQRAEQAKEDKEATALAAWRTAQAQREAEAAAKAQQATQEQQDAFARCMSKASDFGQIRACEVMPHTREVPSKSGN